VPKGISSREKAVMTCSGFGLSQQPQLDLLVWSIATVGRVMLAAGVAGGSGSVARRCHWPISRHPRARFLPARWVSGLSAARRCNAGLARMVRACSGRHSRGGEKPRMAKSDIGRAAAGEAPLLQGPSVGLYFTKYAGAGAAGTPTPPWSHTCWSFLGSFIGMSCIGLLEDFVVGPILHLNLLVAAFGAMSVLLFSATKAPVAQPFNTICGNTLGAFVGVCVVSLLEVVGLDDCFWLSGALSVSLTIVCQELTNTVHPPGGATALIFSMMKSLHRERFLFVFAPAFLGAVVMVAVAVVINNLAPERTYPQWWVPVKSAPEPKQEQAIRTLQSDTVPEMFEESMQGTSSEDPSCAESACRAYLDKLAGAGGEPGPRPKLSDTGFSFVGAFVGMAVLGLIEQYMLWPYAHLKLLVPPFGAMSVLIFSTSKAPLAQPSNVVIGNSIGGFSGVLAVLLMNALGLQHLVWLCGALSVALTIALQERTNTVHPPGGAAALLYAINPAMHVFGWSYVFAPAFLGAVVMVCMGVIMNNLSPERTYPQRWRFDDVESLKA